uniref:Uncharacterized protein n=1 Tax=Xenopus tropicalis TaxID=8364 RepID=A0A803K8H9_XENTR
MGQTEDETYSTILPEAVELSGSELVTEYPNYQGLQEASRMVESIQQSSEGLSPRGAALDRGVHRCLGTGWGAHLLDLYAQGSWSEDLSETPSNVLELRAIFQALLSFREVLLGSAVSQNGQCCDCSIYQRPRGNKEQDLIQGNSPNYGMGTESPFRPDCSPYPGSSEYRSRLSEQISSTQWGVGVGPEDIQLASVCLGLPTGGPDGNRSELQTSDLLLQSPLSGCSSGGCLLSGLGGPIRVYLSSSPDYPESSVENPSDQDEGHRRSPRLAEETLVSVPEAFAGGGSFATSKCQGPSSSWQMEASESSEPLASGLEAERWILKKYGCSDSARGNNTMSKYHKVWRGFCSWASESLINPLSPSVVDILEFLQEGLQKGLSLSTLKGQVSALSAILEVRWSRDPLIERFFKAVLRIRPPVKPVQPTWDLPLVLEFLSAKSFEPLEEIPLWLLTLKTFFLVAEKRLPRIHPATVNAIYSSGVYSWQAFVRLAENTPCLTSAIGLQRSWKSFAFTHHEMLLV